MEVSELELEIIKLEANRAGFLEAMLIMGINPLEEVASND